MIRVKLENVKFRVLQTNSYEVGELADVMFLNKVFDVRGGGGGKVRDLLRELHNEKVLGRCTQTRSTARRLDRKQRQQQKFKENYTLLRRWKTE